MIEIDVDEPDALDLEHLEVDDDTEVALPLGALRDERSPIVRSGAPRRPYGRTPPCENCGVAAVAFYCECCGQELCPGCWASGDESVCGGCRDATGFRQPAVDVEIPSGLL